MANNKQSGKGSVSNKKKQDTCVYKLLEDNKIVYYGTTNNPEKRENEHRNSGKEFDCLKKVSRSMPSESAKKRESGKLESYRHNHKGKNPKYNEKKNG